MPAPEPKNPYTLKRTDQWEISQVPDVRLVEIKGTELDDIFEAIKNLREALGEDLCYIEGPIVIERCYDSDYGESWWQTVIKYQSTELIKARTSLPR